MGEAVAALIVRGGLADVAQSARAVEHALLKEKDFGIAQGVAPFVGDDAGDDGAGSERETDVLGVESGANGDADAVAFVLMERLSGVAATTGHQAILAHS